MKKIVIAVFLVLCLPLSAYGIQKYVTTEFRVNVRSEPTEDSEKLGYFLAGDLVEVIKTSGAWSMIKFSENQEGWMATRFLVDDPPMKEVIDGLKQKVANLEDENKAILLEIKDLENEKVSMIEKNERLEANIKILKNELELEKGKSTFLGIAIGGGFALLGVLIGIIASRPRSGQRKDNLIKSV